MKTENNFQNNEIENLIKAKPKRQMQRQFKDQIRFLITQTFAIDIFEMLDECVFQLTSIDSDDEWSECDSLSK